MDATTGSMRIAAPTNGLAAAGSAGYYDRLWLDFGRTLHQTELDRVQFVVDSLRGVSRGQSLKILDLGCGRGWMAPFISPLGSVTGIDFSPAGIQFAQMEYGEHATFLLADPASPSFGLPADERFDVVVCSEVIEHCPVHGDLLEQISRFLRPGGWCILTTPNGNVWNEFSGVPAYAANLQPVENWLTPRGLGTAFRRAGFRVLQHQGRHDYEVSFRVGLSGRLQHPRIERRFRRLGLGGLFNRLVLPTALYQFVVARKVG
jgi:2-polyprenyl-3-methyl-5-hydroxy-6-metoxy-1,4-benzoquinol methylase